MTKNSSFYSREESKGIVFRWFSMFHPAEKMVSFYPFCKDDCEYVRSFLFFILLTTFQSHCSVQIINNFNSCFQVLGHTRTHLHTARYIAFAFRLCLWSWVKLQKITRVKLRPYAINYVTFDSELSLIWCGKRDFISLPTKTRYCGLYRFPCECCIVYTLWKQKDLVRAEEGLQLTRTETSVRIPDSHNPCALEWG